MDSQSAIDSNDCFLREIPNVKIGTSASVVKKDIVKEELQFLRLDDVSQEKILDTLYFIHGQNFKFKDVSDYEDKSTNLGKKYWIGQGNLVVKGGCNFSNNADTPEDEQERIKQFALLRLESYGFHQNHCIEALEYCSGNIEDSLYLLYCKYFNIPYPFKNFKADLTDEELLEQRVDEKSSLESIYEKSFTEKVKNSVWVLNLKLNYLIKLYHKKEIKKPRINGKQKEKCKNIIRTGTCKYGNKCRFSHELEVEVTNPNEHLNDYFFELEIRFPPNTKYPYEPPIIFLKTNALLPKLVNLHICKRLYDEAITLAQDGFPSIYTITEMLLNEEVMLEHLKTEINFLNPKIKLFETIKSAKSTHKTRSHYKKGLTNRDANKTYNEEDMLKLDKQIVDSFRKKFETIELINMLKSRKKLPVWNYMKQILEVLEEHQVVIVSGETGCGKSTQVPQYLLDDWILRYPKVSNQHIEIVCTQPRRISAIGVAERVAAERLEKVGQTVGYQIRLESKVSASTRLTFCTTGILLRRLESQPMLPNVTHIVVDEVHERSEESDFLLMLLRDLLPYRSDLKVILMSATLNAKTFSDYFCNVPLIEVPGRTFPVKQYFLEEIFETTEYVLEEGSEYSRKVKLEDDFLEIALTEDVSMYSSAPGKKLKDEDLNMKQMCARYSDFSRNTCKNLFLMDVEKINYELIEHVLLYIVDGDHEYPQSGTILIFLPGISEITTLYDQLKDHPEFGTRNRNFILLPLHSSLTSEEQAAIFKKPKNNARKIIISTNLAETSITIDDCVFVIDAGKMKEKRYDPNRNMESLETVWVTRANAMQRKGRAGRVMSGVCFHLYTLHRFRQNFLAQPVPEIQRIPLERLVLNIKVMSHFEGKDVVKVFDSLIEPPPRANVDLAIDRLRCIGALDQEADLTALGHHLAALPVDVRIGKLILYGAIFSCADAALTMAACLSYKNPFVSPFGKKEIAQHRKLTFSTGFSDQITVIIAYKKWLQAYKKSTQAGKNFANENYLSFKTLVTIADIKFQFLEYLVDIGFVSANVKGKRRQGEDDILSLTGNEFNRNGENYRLLSAILCASLYPNVVKILTPSKSFIMSAAGAVPKDIEARDLRFQTTQGNVIIHPSSVNAKISKFPYPYLVYQEKVQTSRIFFRDCTIISTMSLVLFSGFDLDIRVHNGMTFISLEDGWIMLQVEEHKVAEMVKMIKLELEALLEEKIKDPLLNLLHNENSNRTISTILHLISL